MRYTQEEMKKNGYCGGKFYNVIVSLGRWSKVGEVHDGHLIKYPRCHHVGKTIKHVYFDNAQEAMAFTETWRMKILAHIEGKKVDYVNAGVTLRQPFTEAELMRHESNWDEDSEDKDWFDYRFIETLPWSYSISVSKSDWKE